MGADAAEAALGLYGVKRIGVITPYFPVGDQNVVRFFEDSGFNVTKVIGLKCESPVAIAHVTEAQLRDAILAVDSPDVEATTQVGTNLVTAPAGGAGGNVARQAGHRHQHGDLSPCAARQRDQ